MATANRKEGLDDPITPDEIRKLGEAFKDDNFRKLFMEYAEEMNDQENRKKYEEELKIFERERGMDVSFIYPEVNYVVKTVTEGPTQRKIFVNVCSNKLVEKPSCSRVESGPDTPGGLNWNIPYFLSKPQEDLDKAGKPCTVYDAVFHGDTLYMSQKNSRFRKMVEQTALDGVEEKFGVKIKRDCIQYPKMKYKGKPIPSVVRKKIEETANKEKNRKKIEDTEEEILDELQKENRQEVRVETPGNSTNVTEEKVVAQPKYIIKHRSTMNLEDCSILASTSPNTRPKELVISIDLPHVTSTNNIELDLQDKWLRLISNDDLSYDLKIDLPYPIYKQQGKAKFDPSKKVLDVTVPVVPFVAEVDAKISDDNQIISLCSDKTSMKSDDSNATDETKNGNFTNKEITDNNQNEEEVIKHDDVHEMINIYQSKGFTIIRDFVCNQTKEAVVIVVYLENVENSVKVELVNSNTAMVMTASNQDGNHYLAMKLRDFKIMEHNVDTNEKNIALKIMKNEHTCYSGLIDFWDSNGSWCKYNFPSEEYLINRHLNYKEQNDNINSKSTQLDNQHVTVKDITEDSVTVAFQMPTDHKVKAERPSKLEGIDNYFAAKLKQRTSSESSEMSEDLSPMRRYRGILKNSGNWRSISESSDDFGWSSHDLVSPESDCGDSSDRPKKSVRFSENISRTIFKANASILGQKKKNQKRNLNKKKSAAKKGKYSGTSGSESEGMSGTSDVEVNDNENNVMEETDKKAPTEEEDTKTNNTSLDNANTSKTTMDKTTLNANCKNSEENFVKTDAKPKFENLDFRTSNTNRVFALDNNPDFRTNRNNNSKRGSNNARKQRNKSKNSNNNANKNDNKVIGDHFDDAQQYSKSLSEEDDNNLNTIDMTGKMFELD